MKLLRGAEKNERLKKILSKNRQVYVSLCLVPQSVTISTNTNNSSILSFLSEDIENVIDSLKNNDFYEENDDDNVHEEGHEEHKGELPDNAITTPHQYLDISPCLDLGTDQNRAFTYILTHVNSVLLGHPVDPLFLIVHGGPGTGKSTFSRALVRRIEASHHSMLCAAPTGVAATLLLNGQTIHSLLAIGRLTNSSNKFLKKLTSNKLTELKNKFEKCVLLLIDETSMLDPIMLCHANTRLQQIFGNDNPFGGLLVVLVGDFFQLKPVGADAFFVASTKELTDNLLGTPYEIGRDLIVKYKMITFKHQYRSLDGAHTGNINRMRDPTVPDPINEAVINSLKVLSREDFENDPSWAFATIAVCSNQERNSINATQIINFAKANGLPVVKWYKKLNVRKIELPESLHYILQEDEPRLTAYFVPGAPILLTDNLNPSSGLANGTPAFLHSLTFHTTAERQTFNNLIRNAQAGEEITIDPPYAVNVSLPHIHHETWLQKHLSISSEEVVIPLLVESHVDNIVKVNDQNIYFNAHMYDLAFSLTYHKTQGQTKDKIILDLNYRPGHMGNVNFHGMYVGFTRVNFADNIRILPCQDNNNFKHLLDLKPDKALIDWLNNIEKL